MIAAGKFETARKIIKKALESVAGTQHRRYLEAVYYNLVRVSLDLGDWDEAERYYEEGLPLAKLNPTREAARFDFLKGRLLASANPPDFEQAAVLFERSIQADEASGAVVLSAQTKYYFAQMLTQTGETDRSRKILKEISDLFKNWQLPFWQKRCEQALIKII